MRIDRDNPFNLVSENWPLHPTVATAIVEDWQDAETADLQVMLAICSESPDTPLMTTHGISHTAEDAIDPLRHVLSRRIRAASGYTDPRVRVNGHIARFMRQNGDAKRSTVATFA